MAEHRQLGYQLLGVRLLGFQLIQLTPQSAVFFCQLQFSRLQISDYIALCLDLVESALQVSREAVTVLLLQLPRLLVQLLHDALHVLDLGLLRVDFIYETVPFLFILVIVDLCFVVFLFHLSLERVGLLSQVVHFEPELLQDLLVSLKLALELPVVLLKASNLLFKALDVESLGCDGLRTQQGLVFG